MLYIGQVNIEWCNRQMEEMSQADIAINNPKRREQRTTVDPSGGIPHLTVSQMKIGTSGLMSSDK